MKKTKKLEKLQENLFRTDLIMGKGTRFGIGNGITLPPYTISQSGSNANGTSIPDDCDEPTTKV